VKKFSPSFILVVGVVAAIVAALTAIGCALGGATGAASTSGAASRYRTASVLVAVEPEKAFKSAVTVLLERGDVEITNLTESKNRCRAAVGRQKLSLRVLESGPDRSRLSLMVGGGDDPSTNLELAEDLLQAICDGLPVSCEPGADVP
jgi:hypothetical protein